MKIHLLLAIALSSVSLPFAVAKKKDIETESMAQYVLEQLITREKDAYERYENTVTESDEERVRDDLQSIIDGYEKLISESQDYAAAYVAYGMLLNRVGERKAGNAMLLKADELDPLLPIVKNQLGNYMAEESKYQEALGFYMQAIDLNPKEPLYHYQLGNVLLSFRRFLIDDEIYTPQDIDAHMQESFRRAAQLAPESMAYGIRYAQSFFDVNNPDWDAALDEWQQLRGLADDAVGKQLITLYIARVRLERDEFTAAAKLLKQVDHPNLQESKEKLQEEAKRIKARPGSPKDIAIPSIEEVE